MRNIFTLSFAVIVFTFSLAFAGTVTHIYTFDQPSLLNNQESVSVSLNGCWTTGHDGDPALPIKGGKLLLPPGNEAVSITYTLPEPVSLGTAYYVSPVQAQHPLSQSGPFDPTPENEAVYSANQLFPQELTGNLTAGYSRGYSIAYFTVHPVVYNPVTGEIAYYPWIEVSITTEPGIKAQTAHNNFYRGLQKDLDKLNAGVDNPLKSMEYGSVSSGTDDNIVDYLIITVSYLEDSFRVLADYKNASGIATEIVTMDEILSGYTGIDNPDKMRNCVIDYYSNHSTDYALLAGDVEYIPKRSLYATVGNEVDYDLAADLYFGCLDGNWNTDGDEKWGEPGEADLNGEVYVGRSSVDSPLEAEHFINKQILYQSAPVADELTEALMVGEDLEWLSWGSDYKDEIRFGSSSWGYTTAGFPPNFSVETLYDTPGGFYWSALGDLLPLLNEGPQLVNHLGHANNTYALKFGGGSVNDNNMTNDGTNHNFNIIYTQGCYCGAWDNRLPNGSITGSDAICETWTTIANGAVCTIANTRYGWGSYSNTNGSSQYYDREFFDAVWAEDIFEIGRAHQDSKEDCNSFLNYSANRWCYYECCLLGDPTLEIWTDIPNEMSVICDTFMVLGDDHFIVDAAGLSDARCTISQNGVMLASTITDGSGHAELTLSEPISNVYGLHLMVTKHNYIPYSLPLFVYDPETANIVFNEVNVNDSAGDDDGIPDLGETLYLDLILTNFSGVDALSLEAFIETGDLDVEIIDGFESISSISHDATVTFSDAFELQISQNVADGHHADFALHIENGSGLEWNFEFGLDITSPEIYLTDVDLEDGGDKRLSPGESADITLTLTNTGAGEGRLILGSLNTDNPNVTIEEAEADLELLESGQSAELSPVYVITADPECPPSANIPVYLTISDAMGYTQLQMFEIVIGGTVETFETASGNWTHSVVTPGWADEWTLTDYRNYTIGGSQSWHCGPSDGANYANNMDAVLYTPWCDLSDGTTLTFRHWMNAEVSQSQPSYCYDGGRVEMKLDTCIFIPIFPVGGYKFIIRDGPDMGPFLTSTPVYSGEIDWELAVFDLDLWPNLPVQFRFRFGSNSTGSREGWYIDDVELSYMAPVQPPVNLEGILQDSIYMHLTWNSPGYVMDSPGSKGTPRETDDLLHYKVYRNGNVICENAGGLSFDDDLRTVPSGTKTYTVTAVFTKGESVPSNPVVYEWENLNVADEDNLIPDSYFVDSNYPNPFNPKTTIRFGLPEAGNVKITVYNLTGRETAVLLDDFVPAGVHTAVWNAGEMSSGIYFYRFQAEGGFSKLGKMVLVK